LKKIRKIQNIRILKAHKLDISVPGHWVGDPRLGKFKQRAAGTLVERTTHNPNLAPGRENEDAGRVRVDFAEVFKDVPAGLSRSLTYDQDKEMSQHKKFPLTVVYGLLCS